MLCDSGLAEPAFVGNDNAITLKRRVPASPSSADSNQTSFPIGSGSDSDQIVLIELKALKELIF